MMQRVLCVEDNPVNRDIITKLLHKIGYEALEAEDGKTALRLAEQEAPDVILMDYHLPGMNGLEITQRLKASEKTAHIPIIALTADIYSRPQFMEAGCADCLEKPVRKHMLARSLEYVLGTGGA